MNVCTDGDGTRRKVMNMLMKFNADNFPRFANVEYLQIITMCSG